MSAFDRTILAFGLVADILLLIACAYVASLAWRII